MAEIYVGISGFSYPEWRGIFYPPALAAAQMLTYYAEHFPTVELNNTFYRLPAAANLAKWAAAVGPEFRFGVKAHRSLTAGKELDRSFLELFLSRLQALGPKLGPVLFQFPPAAGMAEAERLVAALTTLRTAANGPFQNPWILEVRNRALWNESFFNLLSRRELGLCFNDQWFPVAAWPEPGCGLAYLRLRDGPYSESQLKLIANKLEEWRKRGWDSHVYCRHEPAAPALAERLIRLLAPESLPKI